MIWPKNSFVVFLNPDPYVVIIKVMKVGAAETGPFKDVLLSEQSSILSDMGYRFIVCYYDAPDREEEPTNVLFKWGPGCFSISKI